MSEFINTIDVLGDDAVNDSIIQRTITEFKDNVITSLPDNAFAGCTALTIVDLPAVKGQVGKNVFNNCTALENINLPLVTGSNQSLCNGLSSLKHINIPFLTNVPLYGFLGCTSLVSIDLPEATLLGGSAFDGCTSLTSVNVPKVTSITGGYIIRKTNVKKLDLPALTTIPAGRIFEGAPLTALILRNSTMVSLAGALQYCNIVYGTCFIYVPRVLVDSYKAATNWSTYAAQFRALEDYTVDGTNTGELDETKI